MITVTIEIDNKNEQEEAIKVKNYLDKINSKNIYFQIYLDPISMEKQNKRDGIYLPKELPKYTDGSGNVWTIDLKLRQFRKVTAEPSIEFVGFNTEDGRELFKEYCDGQDAYYCGLSDEYRRMSMTLEDSDDDDVDDDALDGIAEEMVKGDDDDS